MPEPSPPSFLPRPDGQRLAYRRTAGDPARAGAIWLGGFRSDMEGEKAAALHAWAEASGRAYVRFDYFGHGASSGAFEDGTVSRWRDDALAVIDQLTDGPQILIGSSMGGFIALLAALARPERVAGLLLVAPAPDFTERLMWAQFPEEVRQTIMRDGVHHIPNSYGFPPTPITRGLIEDGRRWLLYGDQPLPICVPVKILHGLKDPDVPWRHGLELVTRLEQSPDVEFIRIEDGDHRLSRPADLKRLAQTADALAAQVDPRPEADSSASTAGRPSR
jgi:pimeloyl-ACP methyl ester carboxylesterase